MFYTNRIFSLLHAKSEKVIKSAELTTDKCVNGKVTETNLVHRNSENLKKKKKKINKMINKRKKIE